jgi:hypothetical protein
MRESHALRSIAAEVSNPQVRAQLEQGALNELCQIDRVKDAFGGRCPTLAMLDLDTQAGKFDYCFTRDAGDLNQHRECDRIIKHY